MSDTSTTDERMRCERCNYSHPTGVHPITGVTLIGALEDRELCSSCRVDVRTE